MVYTDLHSASSNGDAAEVERHLKQNPGGVHEKDHVRSARVGWAAACGGGCEWRWPPRGGGRWEEREHAEALTWRCSLGDVVGCGGEKNFDNESAPPGGLLGVVENVGNDSAMFFRAGPSYPK